MCTPAMLQAAERVMEQQGGNLEDVIDAAILARVGKSALVEIDRYVMTTEQLLQFFGVKSR